jgi:hypothetical protein
VCFVTSLVLALVVSGRDDFGFFVVASVPHSLVIGTVPRNLSRLSKRFNLQPDVLGMFAGAVIGYVWAVLVFTFLTSGNPLVEAFQVWLLYYWIIGGVVGIVSAVRLERRLGG